MFWLILINVILAVWSTFSILDSIEKARRNIRDYIDYMLTNQKADLEIDLMDRIRDLHDLLHNKLNHFEEDNPREQSFSKDDILDKLLLLFDGKVGEGFDKSKISEIEKEGADRYKKKIPPGYKDNKKSNNNYGDLIIWKELLQYAKENSKGIIFITGDRKEDWWNK